METTRISTKGQVVIPQAVRDRWRWKPGQKLEVVDTDEGVLLRPKSAEDELFPPTTPEDVGKALNYKGPRIPTERLGIESIRFEDLYPGEEV